MARYTYDQFQKSAQDSGLLGEFSQADLQMARQNPDFGMSILKYKQDYHNAATDEERALANRNAENLRSSWGSYTGGADGGSFTMDLMSPGHFQYGQAAPTYENPYAGDVSSLWQQQQNYGDFSYQDAPTYQNRYDETIQDLIAGILQRPDFSCGIAAYRGVPEFGLHVEWHEHHLAPADGQVGLAPHAQIHRKTRPRMSLAVKMQHVAEGDAGLPGFHVAIVAQLAVQGPLAMELVQELCPDRDVKGMEYYTFCKTTVAGIPNAILSITGYTGAGGCEIYVANEDADKLWEALWKAGEK